MNESRMLYIDQLNKNAQDMGDGAYLAYMQEHGVSAGELEIYANWQIKKTWGNKPKAEPK